MVESYFRDLLKIGYKNEISGRTDKKNTVIHASDIFDFCPRKFCLCIEHDIPFHVNEYIGNSLALTFDIGRKIQDIVIERIKKSGKLIGTWMCECGHLHFGFQTKICPKCKRHSMVYKDTHVKIHLGNNVWIAGNIDILISDGEYIYLGEIKSIKKDEYLLLKEPLLNHQYQIRTYLYMLKDKSVLVNNIPIGQLESKIKLKFYTESGTVIYIPKESVKDPFEKIFSQNLDDTFIKETNAQLAKVKLYLGSGKLPKNVSCKSELSVKARGCQVRKICLK